ncbi:hypothetical protein Lalb_Chr14g0364871 [Lupinus albus]|uniref:Uncharacterized protein n=1 Tax=Lupinus albus TaxID=3870 RepID=A0A6A4PBJ4_LUPAL|nr:hypothetical protein Lalb_Chr14g0364871 [Lupinus albus]
MLYLPMLSVRTQNLKGEDTKIMPSFAKLENVLKFGNGDKDLVDMDEGFTERRIVLEIQDYEGTGANRDHDPKSPGRV